MQPRAASRVPGRLRRAACLAYGGGIALVSLMPAWLFPAGPAGAAGVDKAVHAGMYGVLGILLWWAEGGDGKPGRGWILVLTGGGYGLVLELAQELLAGWGRGFSWGDVLANLAGTAGGWLLAGLAGRKRRRS